MSPTPKARRVSPAEAIATWFCADVADVREGRYQAGRTACPVFVIGEDYFAATPGARLESKEPKEPMAWGFEGHVKIAGKWFSIWRAKG